jgi:hypothetical protein
MAEPPLLESLGAVTALFISILILSAVGRQATRKSFQKRTFLFSLILLIAAVVSNILLTLYVKGPATDPSQALITTKRVQGTFDLLFAISIGVFVLATAKPEIDSWKAFLDHLRKQLPNPFLFYVFVQVLAIAVLWMTEPVPITIGTATRIEFPSIFLFAAGLAFITVITYVPYMLLTYTRRIQARPSTKRDVYMIIAGVLGYTFFEFVVEVVLPYYAIDVRAGGFILEMGLVALVAFAVREKGFLEDLLVPQAEAALSTAPSFQLRRGFTYLVLEENPAHSFEIFRDLVTHGAEGLCITRKPPKMVAQDYGLERTPILWLSRVANQKNCVRPSPPENVAMAVEHFISVGENPVVLLDGFEYLVSHNDFQSVLALLHDLNENVSIRESILLVPLDPKALSEREFALIKRELQVIEAPKGPRLGPRVEVEYSKVSRKGRGP